MVVADTRAVTLAAVGRAPADTRLSRPRAKTVAFSSRRRPPLAGARDGAVSAGSASTRPPRRPPQLVLARPVSEAGAAEVSVGSALTVAGAGRTGAGGAYRRVCPPLTATAQRFVGATARLAAICSASPGLCPRPRYAAPRRLVVVVPASRAPACPPVAVARSGRPEPFCPKPRMTLNARAVAV